MTALKSNLVKRIERLPKPSSVAGALQPLFEAVSNSIHSVQARFRDKVQEQGFVEIVVNTSRDKDDIWATVEDNGLGLNAKNWDAFTTTDTDNKIEIGGKGVGRLLWLDCFEEIKVSSRYKDGDQIRRKSFRFQLSKDDQIVDENDEVVPGEPETGFWVHFKQPRSNGYLQKFPGRDSFVFQHFTSHFLPTIIGGRCPKIKLIVGDNEWMFPEAISDIVYRQEEPLILKTEDYGELSITLMECDKLASSDLKGHHFVHFIAHDRTVHSQCIDGKLGLKYFGAENNRVFHAIVTGEFFDKNVNQERTAFMFEDAVLERVINEVCFDHIEEFLREPLKDLQGEQRERIEEITQSYPSVAFGDLDELQAKLPSGEVKADAIYGHLSRERFRRDQRQAEKIRSVLSRLKDGSADPETFGDAIRDAGRAIGEAEQKSLVEYVVRRKVVLDFIELLLHKVRDDDRDSAYQREDLLHSFICPLRIDTVGSGEKKVHASTSHDLWIIDERLTFAQYFSSDQPFTALSDLAENSDRPDVLIFDHAHGLKQTDDAAKVLIIEFKRPGRTSYAVDENPQMQVEKYIKELQSGRLKDVRGRPVSLNENTIFYCFIVADIIGKLDDWTFSWQRTADGRGRVYRPDSGFKGSIELIGWDELLRDANDRNKAFFEQAGISGSSYFSNENF